MRTLLIEVEDHEAIPEGCFMRFSALGPAVPVKRIRCALPNGEDAVCRVEGRGGDDSPEPAWAAPVDDSSAGQAWLVGGGAHGLRLSPESGAEPWAEPYLLLGPGAIVE